MQRKYIQIPVELFGQLVRYHLLDMNDEEIKTQIVKGLNEKLERMENHDLYTTYKNADSEEKRNDARIKYLDRKGVPQSFRY